MDRLRILVGTGALLLLASCGPGKQPETKVDLPVPVAPIVTPTEELFASPYFPARQLEISGLPFLELSPDWAAACVYSDDLLTDRQKAWVAELGPAGGEGKVAPGFTGDFDGDGKVETVAYGAFAKTSGEQGNFVLVTREVANRPEVILLKELAGPPAFTVFTLKPDGSLWFGGGIDAGEVTMNLTWQAGQPEFHFLSEE